MKARLLRLRPLTMAVAVIVGASGISAESADGHSPVYYQPTNFTRDTSAVQVSAASYTVSGNLGENKSVAGRYVVRFSELSVPTYFSGSGSGGGESRPAGVFKATGALGRQHLDSHNATVQAYVQQLEAQQQQHLGAIASALGRSPSVLRSFKYAINGVVLKNLSAADVKKLVALSKQPGSGIASVRPDYIRHADTDIGPGFIGASSIWFGASASQDTLFANSFESTPGYRGDGIVIGDIDTGYNSSSPSFSATDDHGYTITNPLGSGNFIGDCSIPDISTAGCNDKVIGVYDELSASEPDEPARSVEDSVLDGHGSHTGSTAGGNSRSATINNYTAELSGVAPHANMIIYRGLYDGSGSDSDLAAAAEQAIQDGIVDALNFSISGGSDPWDDPVSLAFLSATDSGIFVAAAAGNTGTSVPVPVPGSANHMEPWVISAAASNHTGGPLVNELNITGTGAPPVVSLFATFTGDNYPGFTTAVPNSPLTRSTAFDNTDLSGTDACTAFAANQFQGQIVLISRGTCTFAIKTQNVADAGAAAIVISDNRVEDVTQQAFTLGAATVNVPVFFLSQADGTALSSYLLANTGSTAAIPLVSRRFPVLPDELASFSLLGPNKFGVIKPDIEAPGVNILATVADDPDLQGPNSVAFYNGTSMATPHTTGTGALLEGLHPDWTPAEAKSAIMMTAKEAGLTKPDATTPSDFFDRGSGRIQAFIASHSGLVMNETGLNFLNANPANNGDPSTLNLASMQSDSCLDSVSGSVTCSFVRRFRSTQDHAVTYAISFTGDVGTSTATPATIIAPAHANALPVTINVDMSSVSTLLTHHFGEMVLTPSDTTLPTLHLPMAIKVPPPTITATPQPLTIAIPAASASANGTLTVNNIGGPTLNVTNTNDTTSAPKSVVIDQVSQGNFGFFADFWDDQGAGSYVADDFNALTPGTNLSKAIFPGFTLFGGSLVSNAGKKVHFEIYSNAAGIPNGNPETVAPSYVWHYVATIGAAGLDVTGDTITLNFATAPGITPTNLSPGTYWMVTYFEAPVIGTNPNPDGWLWFESTVSGANNAHGIAPQFGEPTWTDNTDGGDFAGMAMHIEQVVTCGATWLSAAPGTLTIGALDSAPLTVTADSTKFPAGSTDQFAFLCLDSNDPANPVYATPVHATGGTGAVVAPTVSKAFSPTSVLQGVSSTATITLSNGSAQIATLTGALIDTLPAGLNPTGTATTTCPNGTAGIISANQVKLGAGAQIPATGSCTVTFSTSSPTAAGYTNTINAGDLQTDKGNNASAASATLTVTSPSSVPPTVSASFSPSTVQAYDNSTLTVTFGNANAGADTLTAAFVNTLPSNLVVATVPNIATTCTNATVTANSGDTSVTLPTAAKIPAGGCTLSVNVLSTVAATYTDTIAAGSLQTDNGNNAAVATAQVVVTTLPGACTTQLLGDPSFEQTNAGGTTNPFWTSVDNLGGTDFCTTAVCGSTPTHSGVWALWFGGFPNGPEDGTAQQPVTIPSGFDRTLHFWMEQQAGATAQLAVTLDGTSLATYPGLATGETAYTQRTVAIPSSFADGGSHTLLFHYTDTAAATASIFVDDVTMDCANGGAPSVSQTIAPNNANPNTPVTLTVTLTNPNPVTATLTSALTDTFPAGSGLVIASTPNAATTCPSGVYTATAGASSFSINTGTQIPANGSCTASVSILSPTGGIYTNTIAAGALVTNLGGTNAAAASAVVQINGGAPALSTGFETPTFVAGNLGTQGGWFVSGTATNFKISTTHPQAGTQELRGTWTTAGSGTTFALSPTVINGTSTYSSASADIGITNAGTGAIFDFNPQDPNAGFIVTDVEFAKGAGGHVLVLDASDQLFHDTGIAWAGSATYQHFDVVVNRTTKSMAVCLNGTSIYTGTAFAGNTSNVVVRGTRGTGTTNNIIDADNVVIDNLNTVTCTPPTAPTAPSGPAITPLQAPAIIAQQGRQAK